MKSASYNVQNVGLNMGKIGNISLSQIYHSSFETDNGLLYVSTLLFNIGL